MLKFRFEIFNGPSEVYMGGCMMCVVVCDV